jgi:nucleoside-diphosphate-sugar epimerase
MATSASQRKVLITGAGGSIGNALRAGLRDFYDLRLHYRTLPDEAGDEERVAADITSLEATLPIAEGIDTIVHLAGDPSVSAPWDSVFQNNIAGTYNVLEAARIAEVRRVIFASTNHVMGMYDRNGDWPVYNSLPVRPDSLYGVSKACGEALGRHYHDAFGLSFIALRIGWFMDTPTMTNDIGRAMWLSPRDCVQVVRCAVETGEAFGVFYAVSDNPNRRWDLTDTMLKLGYRPRDRWDHQLGAEEDIQPGQGPKSPSWPDG